jgi:hypothetical protein
MKTYTLKQRYALLATLIELNIYCGYSIIPLIGRPLSYFDFEKVENSISNLQIEKRQIDGHDY